MQPLPREVTCCVHGAAPGFVDAGAAKAHAPEGDAGGKRFSKGAYCLAKVVWGKGWCGQGLLQAYIETHTQCSGLAIFSCFGIFACCLCYSVLRVRAIQEDDEASHSPVPNTILFTLHPHW